MTPSEACAQRALLGVLGVTTECAPVTAKPHPAHPSTPAQVRRAAPGLALKHHGFRSGRPVAVVRCADGFVSRRCDSPQRASLHVLVGIWVATRVTCCAICTTPCGLWPEDSRHVRSSVWSQTSHIPSVRRDAFYCGSEGSPLAVCMAGAVTHASSQFAFPAPTRHPLRCPVPAARTSRRPEGQAAAAACRFC